MESDVIPNISELGLLPQSGGIEIVFPLKIKLSHSSIYGAIGFIRL